jgi:L-alanine-DL-glutamate epimerase-like enolase superfamily enzyme
MTAKPSTSSRIFDNKKGKVMRIKSITSREISIPLERPFKTALRTVEQVDNVLVEVVLESGMQGFGSAAPAAVITGETVASISGSVRHIGEQLTGMDLACHDRVFHRLNGCIVGAGSARAAVDMALHDLLAKSLGIPLYRLLGGSPQGLRTDITISLDSLDRMQTESRERVAEGFNILKIKVGGDPQLDIERLEGLREATGDSVLLRIDANQGWTAKQAVMVGRELERRGINIELMEQQVAAADYEGLRFVRENIAFPVYADESVFSPRDALRLVNMGAVDGLNIKLMKCGGISNGLKIAAIAEAAGIPCMIGSMMECNLSVTAAAHFAASCSTITSCDLDAPIFCSYNAVQGGLSYQGAAISLTGEPGLGIRRFAV